MHTLKAVLAASAMLVISLSTYVVAAGDATKDQVKLNNMQVELLKCAAFHMISRTGFEQSKNPGWESASSQASQLVGFFTLAAAHLGDRIGQSPEGLKARLEATYGGVVEEMEGNFSNYSILLNRYAQQCADYHDVIAATMNRGR